MVKVDKYVVCFGLACITGLEMMAMSQGINGWLLRIVVGIIAATIGVTIPNPISTELKGGRKNG